MSIIVAGLIVLFGVFSDVKYHEEKTDKIVCSSDVKISK